MVALIAGPVGATVGTVAHLGGEDSTGPGLIDSGLDAGPGEGTSTTGSTRGAGHDTDVDVVCTDLVDSSVEDSTWDGSTLRVTIYIQNDCSISQMLADRDARFTVYVADRSYTGDLAGQAAASGDFDFTRQPVALGPGEGGTFTLVFGDRASLDPLAARAATTQGTPTVTYSYTCTEPDGAAGSVGRVRVAADGVGEEERIRSTPTGPARTEADALSRLEAIRADDAPGVSTDLVGRWVPQLSAKQVGLEADGIVYDNRSTLDNHLQLRNTYPEVRLVWSGDFSSFKLGGFWVTLAGVTFPTPEGANGWCDAQGIGPDDCFAKRLSDAGSYEGNTRHRGN